MDNPELHKFFWAWALCLTTSVADTERIHASNNRYIKSAGLWDRFTHTTRTHPHSPFPQVGSMFFDPVQEEDPRCSISLLPAFAGQRCAFCNVNVRNGRSTWTLLGIPRSWPPTQPTTTLHPSRRGERQLLLVLNPCQCFFQCFHHANVMLHVLFWGCQVGPGGWVRVDAGAGSLRSCTAADRQSLTARHCQSIRP